MRKFVYILLSCLMLLGCTKDAMKAPQKNEIPEEVEASPIDVVKALEAIGYENRDNYCIKKIENQGNAFLYVFIPQSGAFQMVELPTLRTYTENVHIDSDTYINTIMNEELVQAKLNPSLFETNEEFVTVDYTSYLEEYEMVNLHQLFLEHSYKEENGFYVKHFEDYSLAINVKGRAITLYTNNTYYRYLSDHSGKKYSLENGYCTYNNYLDYSDNCFNSDIEEITSHYDNKVEPELLRLGLHLYDLDLYYNAMLEKKWGEVRSFEPERFPVFNKEIYTPDPDSEEYVNVMLSKRGAAFTDYLIQVDYKGTQARLYYEDKTFTLANSNAVYYFGLDKGYYNGCSYDFKNGKGNCTEEQKKELKEVKSALYGLLDRAHLNMNELQLCFNVTNKFDKNIPNEVGG